MKTFLALLLMLVFTGANTQTQLPVFLQGTWKMENQEVYEHWDILNEHSMKGFAYKMDDGQMLINEYLEVSQTGKDITYIATVLNQNQGRGIPFQLTRSGEAWVFENPMHDFPKKIAYTQRSENSIFVEVTGSGEKGFSYNMNRVLPEVAKGDTTLANPMYDAILAERLGADNYGMKGYMLVILKTGPNTTTDTQFINQSFRGHLDNINRLAQEGQLVVAGPLGRNDNNYRGIFILNATSIEEARQLLQTDPAVAEGLLEAEIYNWYGSAALPLYLDYSDKIWKQKP
jgi:uncharacterized protein YciI